MPAARRRQVPLSAGLSRCGARRADAQMRGPAGAWAQEFVRVGSSAGVACERSDGRLRDLPDGTRPPGVAGGATSTAKSATSATPPDLRQRMPPENLNDL